MPDPPGNYDATKLHPILRKRLQKAHQRFGLWVASGWRSSQEQERLWNLYQSGNGNPANRPGTSNHEAVPYGTAMGLAVDIHPLDDSGDYATMQRVCREEGLNFIIASENWHAQLEEVATGFWNGLPNVD